MNLRDLKYLVALAEHQHFGKAADACFVSQPTLSMQIKKLEEEFGITLIERNNKNVFITEDGKVMVEHAKQILSIAGDMKTYAEQQKNPETGALSLGIIPTIGPYLLPHIINPIHQHFPKLKLFLHEKQTAVLCEMLNDGKLDAAIMALPIDNENLIADKLYEEPFLAALPKTHPLSKKNKLSLDNLTSENILLLEDGHCLRDQALEFCSMVGAKEMEGFRATSLETLRQMVATNVGVTFLPKLAINDHTSIDNIAIKPFQKPQPSRHIGIFYRKTSAKTDLIKTTGKIIQTSIKPLI